MAAERNEAALLVFVVLHKHIIPDFDVFSAVATRAAIVTAFLFACIDEHFRVRPARTGCAGRTPPVVFARQTVNALAGTTEAFPYRDRLLIGRNVAIFPFYALAFEDGY